jgi:hypothetical protein
MNVHMSPAELGLFRSFLSCAENYLEFGSGGSTCLAASLGKKAIISVDSSDEWLARVAVECASFPDSPAPRLVKVDIGPVGDWGKPTDPGTRDRWPSYYSDVWAEPGSADCDLYLVDGRFRVASFMSVVLRCRPSAIIVVHDFASRSGYHVVKEVCREVARAEDLSVFQIPPVVDNERARNILEHYAYNPD